MHIYKPMAHVSRCLEFGESVQRRYRWGMNGDFDPVTLVFFEPDTEPASDAENERLMLFSLRLLIQLNGSQSQTMIQTAVNRYTVQRLAAALENCMQQVRIVSDRTYGRLWHVLKEITRIQLETVRLAHAGPGKSEKKTVRDIRETLERERLDLQTQLMASVEQLTKTSSAGTERRTAGLIKQPAAKTTLRAVTASLPHRAADGETLSLFAARRQDQLSRIQIAAALESLDEERLELLYVRLKETGVSSAVALDNNAAHTEYTFGRGESRELRSLIEHCDSETYRMLITMLTESERPSHQQFSHWVQRNENFIRENCAHFVSALNTAQQHLVISALAGTRPNARPARVPAAEKASSGTDILLHRAADNMTRLITGLSQTDRRRFFNLLQRSDGSGELLRICRQFFEWGENSERMDLAAFLARNQEGFQPERLLMLLKSRSVKYSESDLSRIHASREDLLRLIHARLADRRQTDRLLSLILTDTWRPASQLPADHVMKAGKDNRRTLLPAAAPIYGLPPMLYTPFTLMHTGQHYTDAAREAVGQTIQADSTGVRGRYVPEPLMPGSNLISPIGRSAINPAEQPNGPVMTITRYFGQRPVSDTGRSKGTGAASHRESDGDRYIPEPLIMRQYLMSPMGRSAVNAMALRNGPVTSKPRDAGRLPVGHTEQIDGSGAEYHRRNDKEGSCAPEPFTIGKEFISLMGRSAVNAMTLRNLLFMTGPRSLGYLPAGSTEQKDGAGTESRQERDRDGYAPEPRIMGKELISLMGRSAVNAMEFRNGLFMTGTRSLGHIPVGSTRHMDGPGAGRHRGSDGAGQYTPGSLTIGKSLVPRMGGPSVTPMERQNGPAMTIPAVSGRLAGSIIDHMKRAVVERRRRSGGDGHDAPALFVSGRSAMPRMRQPGAGPVLLHDESTLQNAQRLPQSSVTDYPQSSSELYPASDTVHHRKGQSTGAEPDGGRQPNGHPRLEVINGDEIVFQETIPQSSLQDIKSKLDEQEAVLQQLTKRAAETGGKPDIQSISKEVVSIIERKLRLERQRHY
jgi:hypothetical protein